MFKTFPLARDLTLNFSQQQIFFAAGVINQNWVSNESADTTLTVTVLSGKTVKKFESYIQYAGAISRTAFFNLSPECFSVSEQHWELG